MIHPHTELRFVSPEIGYGIFATQKIPKGTITWVKDELDRAFLPSEVAALSEVNRNNLLKYTYRNKEGNYFFCWDLTRFVNHSFKPNSMLTTYDFEIAVVDIEAGEEMTNDYGTFNIIEPFLCESGEYVRPDDLVRHHKRWDAQIASAMPLEPEVSQPLAEYFTAEQKLTLQNLRTGKEKLASVLENFYQDP